MIDVITLCIVIAIAIATAGLVVLSIRQGRRTTHIAQKVQEVDGFVQDCNARLEAVTLKCNNNENRSMDACRRLAIVERNNC